MAKLNIITLGSSKTYTNMVSLGLASATVDDVNKSITFTLSADGSQHTIHFDQPSDGVSVTGISDKGNGKFTLLFSDGSESDEIQTLKGEKGLKGDPGEAGTNGKSAYELAKDNGFVGTETEYLESLKGLKGDAGFSPTITENADNTDKIYKLDITTADSTFTTPNLKGADGQGGSGGGGEENKIDSISVNGVNVSPDENKNVDITVPDAYDDTEIRAELANKANTDHTHTTVNGHTVESDVPVDAKFTDTVYNDTQVKTQIQAVANGLMDSVGYSADYKTIDIIAKNGVKKSVNVAPIISHASITELSDVDTTNKATGKALVYNATTSKHEYADVSGTDEKVKMDASTDAKYLGELLDNVTIANENGELKVKKLDGQEVTIAEINYLKGLTMNVMDLVNMFSNGGVKIINTPVATYAELLTIDKSSFIEGISYLVYVLADENHDNAKTTYLVDKDSETPTYFGFADSQRDFTTNPIDLATEITGKLGIANMDSDAIKALFTVDDTYKTETTTNNAFSTHGAKALYDELLLAIGNKANDSDLTAHKDDTDIHVSTTEKDNWNGKADASDLTAHTGDSVIHVTAENKATWNTVSDKVDKEEGKGLSANDYTNEEKALVGTIEDKINKTSIVTALDDTVTDEQVASAFLAKTELDKKIDKTSIVTELSDASTDDEVVSALTAYNELQKLESANKEQFATATGNNITVNDSVDGKLVELGIKGNSFQKSYSGKNLYNPMLKTHETDGVTCTQNVDANGNPDGTYTINGTSTKDRWISFGYTILNPGKYKFIATENNVRLNNLCVSLNSISIATPGDIFTIQSKSVCDIGLSTYDKTFNNVLIKPMLTTNLSATYDDFEPYVGGIPSPNPSYPQAINSVGDDGNLVIKSCGKNLIPYPYYDGVRTNVGLTTTSLPNGMVSVSGTNTGKGALFNFNYPTNASSLIKLDPSKTYAFFNPLKTDVNNQIVVGVRWYLEGQELSTVTGTNTNIINNGDSNGAIIKSGFSYAYVYLYAYASGKTFNNVLFAPMLVEVNEDGTYPTEYEIYKSSTSTIPLSEPLRAIGDIKDEITYQDGKWGVLRRIKEFGISDMSIQTPGNFGDVNYTYTAMTTIGVAKPDSPLLSNLFTDQGYLTVRNNNVIGCGCQNDGNVIFGVGKESSITTIELFTQWASDNDLKLQFILATPVFEPFADQTLPYLSTYNGVTNISNDDALFAEMTVKYPTTDASGVGSRNESRIAELAKDTDEKLSVIGKCKNLLNPALQTTTQNGVTCTNNGDGTYTLNGTATSNATFIFANADNTLTTFKGHSSLKLVGFPKKYASAGVLQVWRQSDNLIMRDRGDGVIITGSDIPYGNCNMAFVIYNGAVADGMIIKPMLTTDLSATYDDFVPYTGDGETLASDVAEIKNDLGGLTFSASGTTLTITDGTNTWTLGANS